MTQQEKIKYIDKLNYEVMILIREKDTIINIQSLLFQLPSWDEKNKNLFRTQLREVENKISDKLNLVYKEQLTPFLEKNIRGDK